MPEQRNTHGATRPNESLPDGIAVGDRVITWYDSEPVEYGGPGDGGPWTTLSFGVLAGGLPVRRCEALRVAPADTPISARDDRVLVDKRPRAEMPYGEPGLWRLVLAGTDGSTWHRTKRDATTTGLRQLAILDWHAGRVKTGPVVLPHTGMTVPHRRFTMSKLTAMSTSRGEAYTAELLLDSKPVGTIENTGAGGPTTWHPLDREVFGWTDLATFVAECRDERGRPVDEEYVLADLFDEARAARDVERLIQEGAVPVRTIAAITSGNEVLSTFADAYFGVPPGWSADPVWIAARISQERPDAVAIQMWTGQRWETLPSIKGLSVRLNLPTTGYVVIGSSQLDGREPISSETFIDVAAQMDDDAAIAHFTASIDALSAHAPSNVVHTQRLVHRSADGDRVLLAPSPVRGAGTPMTDDSGH